MSKRAVAVLLACFLTVFTSFAIRYGYGVLLPEMLPSLAITKAEAGVIFSAFFIGYTALAPILGLLGDRFDARILIAIFMAILGVGAFLMSYSSSLIEASFFFALAGVGSSATWAPVIAVAQRWVSDRRRGITLAFIDVGSSVGIISGGLILPLIVGVYNWNTGWLSLGVLAFLVALVDLLLIRGRPTNVSDNKKSVLEKHNDKPIKATYAMLVRDNKFWLIGFAYLLTGFSIIIPFTFLSTYAVQEMMYSYGAAARLITVIGVGALVGKLGLGYVSDTVGRIRIMMICAVLIAASCLGMAFQNGESALIVFTALFGIGYGTIWAMYAASASDYFSKKSAGGIVGLWTVFLGVGSLASPIIAGWMADTTGTFKWSFILATAGAVASLILLVPVWKTSSTGLSENK